MPKARIVLILMFMVLVLAGLIWLGRIPSRSDASASQPKDDRRATLHIGLIPERDIYQQRKAYRELGDYLESKLGCRVELVTNSSYRGVLEDFRDGKVDGAFLGSLVAALAIERYGASVVVKPEYPDGVSTYHGVIFVRVESPLQSTVELKGHTLGGVRTTTAGALFPVFNLMKEGMLGAKDSPQMVWTGTHDDVIREVFAGKLDAGAVKNLRLNAYLKNHPEAKVRELAVSPEVPENALVVRSGVAPETCNRLRSVLLQMKDDPAGTPALEALGLSKFVPCALRDYDKVYEMTEAIGSGWSEMGFDGPAPHRPSATGPATATAPMEK